MLNIAIVEDDPEAKEILESHCGRYLKEWGVNYQLEWFHSPVLFLTKFNSNYDVIFLDIEPPDMNGIELAHKIRKTDRNAALIFVTNFSVFAVEGYEVDASDYILKPVTYYDFAMKFERVLKRWNNASEDPKIALRFNDSLKNISASDIFYVEVIKHKLVYHTAEGDFEVRGTLKRAEEQLKGAGCSKCNNYCLVGMRYVLGVDGYILSVSTGIGKKARAEIVISHPRKKDFMVELNRFLSEGI